MSKLSQKLTIHLKQVIKEYVDEGLTPDEVIGVFEVVKLSAFAAKVEAIKNTKGYKESVKDFGRSQ